MKKKIVTEKDRLMYEIARATLPQYMSKEEALWVLCALADDFACRCDCLRDEIEDEKEK